MKRPDPRLAEGILLTDMYQLTMAQLYFRMGMHEAEVQFDHFFRRYPDYDSHQAGYCINAGLAWLLDWMKEARFGQEEIEFLRAQRNSAGQPLFADDFLEWLGREGHFGHITLEAIPEGRVIHPNEPLTVVRGPLAMAQILETPLLNHLNYPILVATKASRMVEAGRGRPVLEFGLRRAQERGANAGARAALIGGAVFTSNVGVSYALGLPPKGTHAHSMVQLFMSKGLGELAAFRAYAEIYPDDCLLLVDTVDTLQSGVPHAIQVFEELRRKGHKPVGIRLDSGDLAYLSIQAAKMLNDAGFPDTSIVLSSDLDELVIWQILTQIAAEAPRYGVDPDQLIGRLVFGVGTRLITSWGEPALGGVYKLVAVREGDSWNSAIKISESPAKTPNPGLKRIWRIYDRRGKATADLLSLEHEDPRQADVLLLRHPMDHTKWRTLRRQEISAMEPLLVTILDRGKQVYELPPLEELRRQRQADVERLDDGVRRLVNPHVYHVSLTQELWELKQRLIEEARRENETG
ncbi:nicotinate phosphoribosyltransferase [Litorilinea aerophila]|uniref:Nicotinate phosphoribosyltransferase n=1 Tax=Litorilinea aerophila TaxID=1204385 RepID=A0A540VC21_9CHLR|nr:nicotinate phosphoribosyltransferase [Litorilinea aerophila]MCC9077879.1 nicotinate phosphoribosyltransferase [Litorilinea aerophila]